MRTVPVAMVYESPPTRWKIGTAEIAGITTARGFAKQDFAKPCEQLRR